MKAQAGEDRGRPGCCRLMQGSEGLCSNTCRAVLGRRCLGAQAAPGMRTTMLTGRMHLRPACGPPLRPALKLTATVRTHRWRPAMHPDQTSAANARVRLQGTDAPGGYMWSCCGRLAESLLFPGRMLAARHPTSYACCALLLKSRACAALRWPYWRAVLAHLGKVLVCSCQQLAPLRSCHHGCWAVI